MKIKVEGDKIVRVVKKMEGIEIILQTPSDAKEGIDLIMQQADMSGKEAFRGLRDIKVTSFQEYKTSAVDYKMVFLMEFVFEDNVSSHDRVAAIREFQAIFEKG